MTVIPDDKACATVELGVSYFRPCPPNAPLDIEGQIANQSSRSYHIEVTIRRADGKLLAKAHSVQAISERDARRSP